MRTTRFAFILLILLLGATACTVGPDYQAPEINPPERFVTQDLLSALNEGKEDEEFPVNWWEGFSDPLLDELVADALEQNLRIAAATSRLRAARAGVKLAGAGDNPQAVASGEAENAWSHRLDIEQEEPDETESFIGSLGVLLPLDLFGRTRRRVEAARANAEAAESDLRGLVLDVSAAAVSEYLTLRGNQRQLALLEESVDLQEQTLSIVTTRYESGLSPELDLRRAETSVERLRAGIPRLQRDLLNSRNRLATLTGRYPGALEEKLTQSRDSSTTETQSLPSYQARVAEAVPLDVLARRPDIQEAEAFLKQTTAEIGIAKAELYPTLDLAAQVSVSATGVNDMPTVELLFGSISAMLQQVIWEGGARVANIEIARARAEAALSDYRQALLDASEEVEATLAALEASRRSQVSLEKAVKSSSRSFAQAEALYQQGLISFLDVVDAQRSLADTEQALAAERTNYATQIAELFRVLGTRVERSFEMKQVK